MIASYDIDKNNCMWWGLEGNTVLNEFCAKKGAQSCLSSLTEMMITQK